MYRYYLRDSRGQIRPIQRAPQKLEPIQKQKPDTLVTMTATTGTTATLATTDTAKIRNLESSILFLQQEHAETLKCLHDEIRTLQKKNSDLTFRAEMGPAIASSDDALHDKVKELEKELSSNKKRLERSDDEKDKRIQALEKQIKSQERTFRDELKAYSGKLRKYQQELSLKSDTIAELQHKLHHANVELSANRRSSDTPPLLVPTPPKEGAPRLRRGSRKTIVPIEVKSIPTDRPLSASSLRDYVLDPSPFLLREGSPIGPSNKPRQSEPLPPISGSSHDHDRNQSPGLSAAALRRISLSRDNQIPAPEAEVVELAIGQVQKNENWRQARPSHSSNLK